mgnify:CR=1 FL=1|tara:strand:+ start:113191 stop:114303 length:1113 start_codon:yes stop_codon:yes gene_type:complete
MKQTLSFVGTITAVTPLAVSRPNDNFPGGGHSDKMQRLPRAGAKHQDTPVFFPGSTLNGAIRRAATRVVRRALTKTNGDENPFSMDDFYMLVQGVDTADIASTEGNTSGLVAEEGELREANPFISLFGRWGLPGHLGVSDAMPEGLDNAVMYVTGNGARVNEWTRHPEAINFIRPEDRDRIKKVLVEDSLAQKDIAEMKDQVKGLKKELRGSDEDEKAGINKTITNIESEIDAIKKSKAGAKESIQRPLDGYECIAPGTDMTHKMMLTNASQIELGLLIHTLAEFSRDPRLGAHRRHGAGEVKAFWDVKVRPEGSWKPVTLGRVTLSWDGFEIEDLTEDKVLTTAAEEFERAIANLEENGINFLRFSKIA